MKTRIFIEISGWNPKCIFFSVYPCVFTPINELLNKIVRVTDIDPARRKITVNQGV